MRFAIPSRAHKTQMRIYGAICSVSGVTLFFMYHANTYARAHGGHDLTFALGYGIVFSVFAVLLLALQVWAELLLSLCLAVLALAFVYGMIVDIRSTPEVFYNVPFVLLLLVPVSFTIQRLRRRTYFQLETSNSNIV